jgi:hypothetical protein
VQNYQQGRSEKSRVFAHRNADNDPQLQGESIMGEVGFAKWLGLDPNDAVNWGADFRAWDVEVGAYRVDVKSIKNHYHLLLWSVAKNEIWKDKDFHILFLMKVCEDGVCFVGRQTWIAKPDFFANKQVADADCPWRLDPGTWYMHERDLWFTDHFLEFIACLAPSRTTG